MPRIHLFNPENDLALAHGGRNYTAPPNAMALHRAGAMLPLWYGDNGDAIIAPDSDQKWLDEIASRTNILPCIFNRDDSAEGYTAMPWGWSLDARRQLLDAGVPETALIYSEKIEKLRQLSHRRTTIEVMKALKERLSFDIPPLPLEAFSGEDVIQYAHLHNGCFIKSPWSSSGRGVVNASALSADELRRRAEGVIRRQGSIMCETPLDKVVDFAMLFHSDGKTIKKLGYSLFYTGSGTAYTGNIVADDSAIEAHLSTFVSQEQLRQVSTVIEETLSDIIAPHYNGDFGVDMLIYQNKGEFKISPCIEINLRMTMGIVAWHLNQKHLAKGNQALFRVEYSKSTASGLEPLFANGRLVEGTLSLIPPRSNFHITLDASRGSKILQFGI